MTDLSNLDELKRACVDVVKTEQAQAYYETWGKELRQFLNEVRDADLATRMSVEFQRKIWEENPVTTVGGGQISVEVAVADPEFRKWLAEKSVAGLPNAREPRATALDTVVEELETRMKRYTNRMPRLKIYRVLACFFPSDFTTVSDVWRLGRLHSAMFGRPGGNGPSCHANILRKLSEAMGPAGDDLGDVVDRMRLPWLLYERYVERSVKEKKTPRKVVPEEDSLVPLPAARRSRGLTGITGGFQATRSILEFCRDGVPREDLKSYIRTISPTLKENSINAQINVIARELNCLKLDGDRCVLTDRGHAFLESGDAAELMDWLLTRILGVDHVLDLLQTGGPHPRQEIVSRIQQINPNWTTEWVPRTIIKELQAFGMLDSDENDVLSLGNYRQ